MTQLSKKSKQIRKTEKKPFGEITNVIQNKRAKGASKQQKTSRKCRKYSRSAMQLENDIKSTVSTSNYVKNYNSIKGFTPVVSLL